MKQNKFYLFTLLFFTISCGEKEIDSNIFSPSEEAATINDSKNPNEEKNNTSDIPDDFIKKEIQGLIIPDFYFYLPKEMDKSDEDKIFGDTIEYDFSMPSLSLHISFGPNHVPLKEGEKLTHQNLTAYLNETFDPQLREDSRYSWRYEIEASNSEVDSGENWISFVAYSSSLEQEETVMKIFESIRFK